MHSLYSWIQAEMPSEVLWIEKALLDVNCSETVAGNVLWASQNDTNLSNRDMLSQSSPISLNYRMTS